MNRLKHLQKALCGGVATAHRTLLKGETGLAYVGGWLGRQNLGDELLLDAVRLLFPGFVLTPYNGGRIGSLLLRAIPRLKGGLLGGGTIIASGRGYLETAQRFVDLGLPLAVFGTGVEEESFWEEGTAVKEWLPVLRESTFLGVRGPLSAERLHREGLDGVKVVGDPVLALACERIEPNPRPRTLGLNVGTADGRVWGSEAALHEEFAALAAQAKAEGWTVHWFVVWPKDLPIVQRLARQSDTAEHVHVIYQDHATFLNHVRPLTAFVGMKLHATALATCAYTPSLMVEYRPKCRDFMASIGQQSNCIRSDEFSADRSWDWISDINQNREEAAHKLLQTVETQREHQAQSAKAACAILSRGT